MDSNGAEESGEGLDTEMNRIVWSKMDSKGSDVSELWKRLELYCCERSWKRFEPQ